MARTSLPAKICIPRLVQVLPRKRLFGAIDRARKQTPVVWIAGPAGSGKTTLVASYLKTRKLSCLWYQVDEGDTDPATLFHYLILAARKCVPGRRLKLPHLTPEYRAALSLFTRRYFEQLYAHLKPETLLVFDNCQEMPADGLFYKVMCEALAVIPEGVNVVFISRTEVSPPLSRLHVGRSVVLIGGDKLRLTLAEAYGIARLSQDRAHRRRPLPGTLIRHIHHTTQGWVAALVLMLRQPNGIGIDQKHFDGAASKILFDYFSSEVFARTPHEVQDFLLKTAFLPQVSADAARQISGNSGAHRVLADLVAKNHFTVRLSGPREVYRYHDLYREFLLSRAREVYSPSHLSGIQHRAAKILEAGGQPEEAVELFRKAGDWEGVIRLILKYAPSLISQGRNNTLEDWIGYLPKVAVEESPWLMYWRGACRFPFYPVESRYDFEKAFDLFSAGNDPAGTLLAWSSIVDTFAFFWDSFRPLDRWIQWLDQRVKSDPTFPSLEIEARVAASMAAALLFRQPQHPEMEGWMTRALALSRQVPDLHLRMRIWLSAANYHSWRGDLAKFGDVVEELKKLATSSQATPLMRIMYCMWEACYQWFKVSPERCLQAVEEGMEVARRFGIHMWDSFLLGQEAYSVLSMGDLKKSKEYLSQMVARIKTSRPHEEAHTRYLCAWHALLAGDLSFAFEEIKRSHQLIDEAGAVFLEALNRLAMVQVLMERGERDHIPAYLAEVARVAEGMRNPQLMYMHLLAEAQFALEGPEKEQNRARGLRALWKAMAIGKEQGYFNMLWWRSNVMARLCAKALEEGIEVEYVQALIRKRGLVLEDPPLEVEAWPWKVKVYTLGRFSVMVNGKPLEAIRRNQYAKPLALMKALLASGGQEIRQSDLTEALWPEAEGDLARQVFDTTLHRLRTLLGVDLLVLEEGKLRLDPRRCWVDLWALERIMERLDQALKQPTPDTDTVCALAEKLLGLYAGPFLREESDAPWVLSRRERVHARIMTLLQELGHCWERKEDWERAVGCYQKGLAVDPLIEVFYQRLMVSYQKLGRRAEALSTYRRCRESLNAHLQVPPAPATEAIYRQIREGR